MSPERWQQIEEIYHSALERAAEERAAFLDEACGGDAELRREVESLLQHGDSEEALVDRPAWEAAGDLLDTHTMDQAGELAGHRISHYEILQKLGEGGMGRVYRAVDTRLGRTVAIKVVDAEFTQRFEREARAIAALNHPHICTLHDVGEHEGAPYLVMEYIEGKPLKGPLPTGEALRYSIQICEALAAAHKAGIVHRDLKPDNILLTGEGSAKVLDFGLAKLQPTVKTDAPTLTTMTERGAIAGTGPYMSPEQAQGEPVDSRSDIFSFGAVLYELLSGRRAFRRETTGATLAAVIAQEPPQLKEAPSEVARIVGKMLAKKREDRYQSAEEILTELERELRALRPRAVLRQLRRRRVAVPLALGLGVLGVAGYAYADRRAKVRWARETALPQIERMIEENDVWRNLVPPYRLAEKAEAIIPRDPRLAELYSKCSLKIDIKTEPPGAKVYMKEYATPESEWTYLGVSPIVQIRVPIGIFRWRFEKEGYEPVLAASSTWDIDGTKSNALLIPYNLTRTLDQIGGIPTDMVRVQGAATPNGAFFDFFIDRHEVTNKQYKDFLNQGGYRNEKYWKHKFIGDGKELSWQRAMKEFVDQTGQPGPATWQAGDYPEGQADYPVSGISWFEAAAYAEYAGKSLPTGAHWELARGGFTPMIMFPQLGGSAVFAPFSNFTNRGSVPVESMPGITSFGAYDMAGNVREWCWNETPKGRLIRGGAWGDNTYMFKNQSQAPAVDRSARNGLRCALYPDLGKIPEAAFGLIKLRQPGDSYSQKPVPDSIFQVYREQFSYDRTDLRPRVESRQERSAGWIHEKITFDAAYGGERIIAHLFLPRSTAPPYQTVIYFPGSDSTTARSSDDLENYHEFSIFLSFVVKSGRAALYPVYKGTFERGTAASPVPHVGDESHAYTEYLVQVVKDFRRCVDYLETRQDIDSKRLAFYGMSWGGRLAAIIPAVENRLKANVVLAGGLDGRGRPEANEINYISRVRTPTLMLTGRYDTIFDLETSQKPMFNLLGAANKQWKVYPTDHIPPRTEFIRETLAWLDRYLGPVR